MAGIAEAASIIGITDFAVRSVQGLYGIVKDYRGVADEVEERFRTEITCLQSSLSGLGFLTSADQQTHNEVKETGVAEAMNDCGESCAEFETKLSRWIKRGPDSFRDRVKVMRNKGAIGKYTSKVWTTARLLDTAVGILTL